jgi:hypothetical protein
MVLWELKRNPLVDRKRLRMTGSYSFYVTPIGLLVGSYYLEGQALSMPQDSNHLNCFSWFTLILNSYPPFHVSVTYFSFAAYCCAMKMEETGFLKLWYLAIQSHPRRQ